MVQVIGRASTVKPLKEKPALCRLVLCPSWVCNFVFPDSVLQNAIINAKEFFRLDLFIITGLKCS